MSTALEIMAVSLGIRFTHEELEWLSMALKEQAEQKRHGAESEAPVLTDYRASRQPVRRVRSSSFQ
jgi:hypothetical protein